MTLLTLAANSIGKQRSYWTVSKHSLSNTPIYLSVDKFEKILEMNDARKNTAWQSYTQQNSTIPVTIEIMAILSERWEAEKWRFDHEAIAGRLFCNENGYDNRSYGRLIYCSDGRRFSNQKEAAQALGVTQGYISQYLSGKHRTVAGLTLKVGDDQPAPSSPAPPPSFITPPPPEPAWDKLYPPFDHDEMEAWKRGPMMRRENGLVIPPFGWTDEQYNHYLRELAMERYGVAAPRLPAQPMPGSTLNAPPMPPAMLPTVHQEED